MNLCNYLFNGVVIEPLGGGETCFDIITPGLKISKIVPETYSSGEPYLNTGIVLTDGVWYWNGFHLYYLKHYHLRLHSDFVLYAESQNWRIDAEAVDIRNIDFMELRRTIAEGC